MTPQKYHQAELFGGPFHGEIRQVHDDAESYETILSERGIERTHIYTRRRIGGQPQILASGTHAFDFLLSRVTAKAKRS